MQVVKNVGALHRVLLLFTWYLRWIFLFISRASPKTDEPTSDGLLNRSGGILLLRHPIFLKAVSCPKRSQCSSRKCNLCSTYFYYYGNGFYPTRVVTSQDFTDQSLDSAERILFKTVGSRYSSRANTPASSRQTQENIQKLPIIRRP